MTRIKRALLVAAMAIMFLSVIGGMVVMVVLFAAYSGWMAAIASVVFIFALLFFLAYTDDRI